MARSGSNNNRQNRSYDKDEDEFTTCNWLEYTFVVVLACLLLLSALVLVVFWTIYFHGYGYKENPEKLFNAHPTLMIAGFITLSGFSILLYRISRCCRHVYIKLFHTIFHMLATVCIAFGFLAVFYSKSLSTVRIRHFYSLHSWMGLATMGTFALQFVVGFFSFLILLCCDGATAACRAAFVPIHASFGLTTFMLAIATCLTGLTEKIISILKEDYSQLQEQAIIINVLAMVLVALGILMSYILHRNGLRSDKGNILTERL